MDRPLESSRYVPLDLEMLFLFHTNRSCFYFTPASEVVLALCFENLEQTETVSFEQAVGSSVKILKIILLQCF